MGINTSSVATPNAGRIFLAPQPLEAPQIWLNIGYDSYDGFQIPEYIDQFKEICTKEQYDALMNDVKAHFEKQSVQPCCARFIVFSILFPPLLLCSIPYSERRRHKFDAQFDGIVRHHQRAWNLAATKETNENALLASPSSSILGSPKSSPTRRDSIKRTGLLRWTYGFPLPIAPNKAYDSTGKELIANVESNGARRDEAAWPPPFYNIVFTIPQGYHYRIRNRWPGESTAPLEDSPNKAEQEEQMKRKEEQMRASFSLSPKRFSYKSVSSSQTPTTPSENTEEKEWVRVGSAIPLVEK